jgi:4-hydroxy-tetrahydrodipicolinate synthase
MNTFTKQTRLHGVIAAIPTPVNSIGQPDTTKLIAFCRRLLDTGCDGINLLGTTGEATSFDTDTRISVMRAVAREGDLAGRMMVGTGTTSQEETVILTRAADSLGFSGALLLPPFFYPDSTDDGLFAYFGQVVEQVKPTSCNFYLYNIPQNTGVRFSPELVRRLRDAHPKVFVGLKDSSGVIEYASALAQELHDFDVFPSNEATLAVSRERGFAGCISASVNIAPWLAKDVYERQESKSAAFSSMVGLRKFLSDSGLVPTVKAAVAILQKDESWGNLKLPLLPLTNASILKLHEHLQSASLLHDYPATK